MYVWFVCFLCMDLSGLIQNKWNGIIIIIIIRSIYIARLYCDYNTLDILGLNNTNNNNNQHHHYQHHSPSFAIRHDGLP